MVKNYTPRLLLGALLCVLVSYLVACLAAAERDKGTLAPQPPPAIAQPPAIVILGNSITLHEPAPGKGWNKLAGMAASDLQHDYAHELVAKLGVPPQSAYIRNLYPIEVRPSSWEPTIRSLQPVFARRPKVVVLQLGDNVRRWNLVSALNFWRMYSQLGEAINPDAEIICLTTFWDKEMIDAVIRSACPGQVVDIGDLYERADNADRKVRTYDSPGVERHPKDWAMEKIAEAVAQEIRS